VTTQDDEPRTSVVKLDQEITKLFVELDHRRVRGTKRIGMLWRA
jgi:hypothetical protein